MRRDWLCPGCKKALGYVTASGDLIITTYYVSVDVGRYAVTIRCRCGKTRSYDNGQVKLRTGQIASPKRDR